MKLINHFKLWLFRKLMDDICRHSTCKDCEAYRFHDERVRCSCAQSETLAQAMALWSPKSEVKERDEL